MSFCISDIKESIYLIGFPLKTSAMCNKVTGEEINFPKFGQLMYSDAKSRSQANTLSGMWSGIRNEGNNKHLLYASIVTFHTTFYHKKNILMITKEVIFSDIWFRWFCLMTPCWKKWKYFFFRYPLHVVVFNACACHRQIYLCLVKRGRLLRHECFSGYMPLGLIITRVLRRLLRSEKLAKVQGDWKIGKFYRAILKRLPGPLLLTETG